MYLKCPREWYNVLYWHHDLQIKRSQVLKTSMEDIALAVSPSQGLSKLKYDIVREGLLHPIIVIDNTEENYEMAIRQITPDLIQPFDNTKPYLAYTGNQRILIAKKWKYRYISSIVMPDVHWAHAAQIQIQDGKVDNRYLRSVQN